MGCRQGGQDGPGGGGAVLVGANGTVGEPITQGTPLGKGGMLKGERWEGESSRCSWGRSDLASRS